MPVYSLLCLLGVNGYGFGCVLVVSSQLSMISIALLWAMSVTMSSCTKHYTSHPDTLF